MIPQLRASELTAWLAARPGPAAVLDVREPWELQVASVQAAGFELIAIPLGELPARQAELPRDVALACLCHHGVRSQYAAQFLAQHGFTDLVNLQGGIDAWSCEFDASVPRY